MSLKSLGGSMTAIHEGQVGMNLVTHSASSDCSSRKRCNKQHEKSKLSELANSVNRVGCREFRFGNFMETILDFAFAFEKRCGKKFISTQLVMIVRETTSFKFLTGIRAQFYFTYVQTEKFKLRHKGSLALLKRLNADHVGSRGCESPLVVALGHTVWQRWSY